MTLLERARLLRRLSGDKNVPTFRYRIVTDNSDALEILREFDAILWYEAVRPFDNQERIDASLRISRRLLGSLCWDLVHNNYDEPFLQDILQAAIVNRLEATQHDGIGISLLRGIRDAWFLRSASLANLYCEQILHAVARKPPPPMNEVIRLLETLKVERRRTGALNGVPWDATLQELEKTYVVQLPIPADAPQTDDCLPVPASEPEIDATELPRPARAPWWRRR